MEHWAVSDYLAARLRAGVVGSNPIISIVQEKKTGVW